MSQGQEFESEDDWLFDYMMETFRSPTWEVPVMTFTMKTVLYLIMMKRTN